MENETELATEPVEAEVSAGTSSRVSWVTAPSPSQQYVEPRQSMADQIQSTRKNLMPTLDRCETDDLLRAADNSTAVYLRIRPYNAQELQSGASSCIQVLNDRQVSVTAPADSVYALRNSGRYPTDYTFSHVFDGTTSQETFFNETALPLTDEVLDGRNALLFSYGVTSSGKTYTIQGTDAEPGVLPRTLDKLFTQIEPAHVNASRDSTLNNTTLFKPEKYSWVRVVPQEQIGDEKAIRTELLKLASKHKDTSTLQNCSKLSKALSSSNSNLSASSFEIGSNGRMRVSDSFGNSSYMDATDRSSLPATQSRFVVWVSFCEIYKENVFDLLVPVADVKTRRSLKVSQEEDETSYVAGLRWIWVESAEEALKLLQVGQRNLQFAATKLNYTSSRSHGVFTVRVLRIDSDAITGEPKVTRISNLCICDLAGSERASRTEGERSDETGKINTSLLCLSRCLHAIRKQQHIRSRLRDAPLMAPFRESKLTQLLKDYLTGSKGRTRMVVNVGPADNTFGETLVVMKFSAIARKVRSCYGSAPPQEPNVVPDERGVGAVKRKKTDDLMRSSNGGGQQSRPAQRQRERTMGWADDILEEQEVDDGGATPRAPTSDSVGGTGGGEASRDSARRSLVPEYDTEESTVDEDDDEENTAVDGAPSLEEERDWYKTQYQTVFESLRQERIRNLRMETDIRAEVCNEFSAQMEKYSRRDSMLISEERARAENLAEARINLYRDGERKLAESSRKALIEQYEGDEEEEGQWVADHIYQQEKAARMQAEEELKAAREQLNAQRDEHRSSATSSALSTDSLRSSDIESLKEELQMSKRQEKDALEMLQEAAEKFRQQEGQIATLTEERTQLQRQLSQLRCTTTHDRLEHTTADDTQQQNARLKDMVEDTQRLVVQKDELTTVDEERRPSPPAGPCSGGASPSSLSNRHERRFAPPHFTPPPPPPYSPTPSVVSSASSSRYVFRSRRTPPVAPRTFSPDHSYYCPPPPAPVARVLAPRSVLSRSPSPRERARLLPVTDATARMALRAGAGEKAAMSLSSLLIEDSDADTTMVEFDAWTGPSSVA